MSACPQPDPPGSAARRRLVRIVALAGAAAAAATLAGTAAPARHAGTTLTFLTSSFANDVDTEAPASFAVGYVLRLSHRASDPLDVVVGDATFAQATAGSHGARLAALVVGTASTKENA